MVLFGWDGEFRNIGLYDIQYKRVLCEYFNQNIVFKLDYGVSVYWLFFIVKYMGGLGDIESVEVLGSNGNFQFCQYSWGVNWMLINYFGQLFKGLYDVKIMVKLNGYFVVVY